MKQIDPKARQQEPQYDAWHYIGYMIAVVIVVPIGVWLKQSGIADAFINSILGPIG
ncbi:hypothetical protein [Pelagibacterium luteolum]|nr:hypothetical protein [Pelagibacterium luteolum]